MEDLDNVSAPFPRYTGYSVPWYNPMGLGPIVSNPSGGVPYKVLRTPYSVRSTSINPLDFQLGAQEQ
jgi:hypothetical protein